LFSNHALAHLETPGNPGVVEGSSFFEAVYELVATKFTKVTGEIQEQLVK
jgi:hypothetical protein